MILATAMAGPLFSCALPPPPIDGPPQPSAAESSGTRPPLELLDVPESKRSGPYFERQGRPFCFVGTNNYYLTYKDPYAVSNLLDTAQRMGLRVIRVWAFLDRGSLDGSVPDVHESGHKEGVYFQYWDAEKGAPAYNDGKNGLERLDLIVHEARKRGLLLSLVLTNNWPDFGGMDQYLLWYGLDAHHLFFTDPRVRRDYRAWVKHLVSRTNSIDGVPYREDPAIFSWELANEPRAENQASGEDPKPWSDDLIVDWAREMSSFVKSLDSNHMVAVGDEGFFRGDRDSWMYQAPFAVDTERLLSLPSVDYGTFHLYPDHWGIDPDFGNTWIEDHVELAHRANKPVILEEYGLSVRRERETSGAVIAGGHRRRVAYTNWNELAMRRGVSGSLFWMLAGEESPRALYPDYDHFAIYEGDRSFDILSDYAAKMPTEAVSCRASRATSRTAPEVESPSQSPFVDAHAAPLP